jgi:hypothetical protein
MATEEWLAIVDAGDSFGPKWLTDGDDRAGVKHTRPGLHGSASPSAS